MRIGYPCINRSAGCTANRTFRLASYNEQRLHDTVAANLACLEQTLVFNARHGLRYFRIGSGLVPFASHPVCRYDWRTVFSADFRRIGRFIRQHGMRIAMHPDQFIVLNSPKPDVVDRSIAELVYHAAVLDAMQLPLTAKIQLHAGGVYGDRAAAMQRFTAVYKALPQPVQRRLVIENDDRLYSLHDCLELNRRTGVPVLFDTFHHECLNNGEPLPDAVAAAAATWNKRDGCLLADYSSQKPSGRFGAHTEHIDIRHFTEMMHACAGTEFDLMLEIKDKEKSALTALEAITQLNA